MSENSVNSKTVKFTVPKVLTVKEEARNMFREKREQRQILLKAKIEAQRKERNGSKDRLVVKPIEKKPVSTENLVPNILTTGIYKF